MERITKFRNCKHQNIQQFTEICLDCGENIYTTESEIRQQEIDKKEQQNPKDKWNESGW